jgi:phage shock protein A
MAGPISALLNTDAPSGTWGEVLPQGVSLAQSVYDGEVAALQRISNQIEALQNKIADLRGQAAIHEQTRDSAAEAVKSMTRTLDVIANS